MPRRMSIGRRTSLDSGVQQLADPSRPIHDMSSREIEEKTGRGLYSVLQRSNLSVDFWLEVSAVRPSMEVLQNGDPQSRQARLAMLSLAEACGAGAGNLLAAVICHSAPSLLGTLPAGMPPSRPVPGAVSVRGRSETALESEYGGQGREESG